MTQKISPPKSRFSTLRPMSDRDTPAPPPPGRNQIFFRRLGSFAVLWTVVLAALFSGPRLLSDAVFLLVMLILAVFGLREFYGIARKRELVCFQGWGIVGGALLVVGTFLHCSGRLAGAGTPPLVSDFETPFLVLFVLGLCVRQFVSRSNTAGIVAIAVTLFGLMYVPWLLSFITKINYFPRLEPGNGAFYVLYFALVTKFSDTGAYCVGTLIGRRKMIPRVSPGKTWEGFGGALLVSVGVSLLFAHFAGGRLQGMTLAHAALLGVILCAGAVVGDLIESLFKREAGLKDSGRRLPGIGGVLDLLDSLLFNAPLMYLYLRHVLVPA